MSTKTIEQKAIAYDEALKCAKMYYKENKDYNAGFLSIIFPQLRESEDERIRQKLIDVIKYFRSRGIDQQLCEKFLAYLEKQKDLNNMIVVSPEVWDNAIADAYENGKKDGEKQKEPRYTKRNALFDKCVENCDPAVMKKVSDEVDEMLEKEQKPIISAEESLGISQEEYNKIVDECIYGEQKERKSAEIDFGDWDTLGYIRDIVREHVIRDEEFNMLDKWLIEHYVEQKPAEWSEEQDYSGLSDLERAIHRGFLCAGVENVPVAIIKETAKEVQSILKAEG